MSVLGEKRKTQLIESWTETETLLLTQRKSAELLDCS